MLELLKTMYEWAARQPVFIQVVIGIVLCLVGLYALGWIMGYGFLFFLKRSEKGKNKEMDEVFKSSEEV